jgi:hypothetical protein
MTMKDRHNEPATKGDIAELRQELHDDLKNMRRENAVFHKELMRQLGVIDEQLRHDVLGAGNDRIVSLRSSMDDHEQRIRQLEKSAGLIAA